MLSVLAPPARWTRRLDILFAETTTLGVRTYETRRRKLPREELTVTLPGGEVRVKVASLRGEVKNVAPNTPIVARWPRKPASPSRPYTITRKPPR